MKKSIYLIVSLMFVFTISKAQTTAMQFSGVDCNGNMHDLFADLDAGKAVVIHYYMPNCGSCPPPAQKIQAMANKINGLYPGMVKGYAFPFQNSTTCAYSSTWVSSNGLSSIYSPMDSGAAQVAYYGGFGMPTVVLLGGSNHRVMFSTLSFSTSDTTQMRDSIMALLSGSTGIINLNGGDNLFSVYPNPANNSISISLEVKEMSDILIDVTNLAGEQVALLMNEKRNGVISEQFNTAKLPVGNYLVRLQINGKITTQKITVTH